MIVADLVSNSGVTDPTVPNLSVPGPSVPGSAVTDAAPSALVPPASVPIPLQGCLYCHAEGTTTPGESRKLFGLGTAEPIITCSSCGAVAQFEASDNVDGWRIRYRDVNAAARFYYVKLHLGQAGWLDANLALTESRRGFIQRLRVQQTQSGDLHWLRPAPLSPAPPLMSPDEQVYLMLNPASVQNSTRAIAKGARTFNLRAEGSPQDTGRLYVTDRKIHLLGHRRDWSHKLSDVQYVDYNDQHWRIYVSDGSQFYQGENLPNQLDAQLFATVVKALSKLGDGKIESRTVG